MRDWSLIWITRYSRRSLWLFIPWSLQSENNFANNLFVKFKKALCLGTLSWWPKLKWWWQSSPLSYGETISSVRIVVNTWCDTGPSLHPSNDITMKWQYYAESVGTPSISAVLSKISSKVGTNPKPTQYSWHSKLRS